MTTKRKPAALRGDALATMTRVRDPGLASTASGNGGGMMLRDLRQRIKEAVALGCPVTLAHSEAQALVEVAEAASTMFETTLDRNVARRRMERLQVALARLDER
jgi:hypothetical protein